MVHPIQGSRFCQEISVPAFAMSSAEMTASPLWSAVKIKSPFQNLLEIVIFWRWQIILGLNVIVWRDVLQTIVENQFSLRAVQVDETRFNLAVFVFHILQVKRQDFALRVGRHHGAGNALVKEFLHAVAQ